MFLHVVLMEFNETADAQFFTEVQAHANRIRAECENLLMYEFRSNIADRSDGLNYAVVSGFTDSASHDAYQVCSAHVAMKNFMAPHIKRITVFDGDANLLTAR